MSGLRVTVTIEVLLEAEFAGPKGDAALLIASERPDSVRQLLANISATALAEGFEVINARDENAPPPWVTVMPREAVVGVGLLDFDDELQHVATDEEGAS